MISFLVLCVLCVDFFLFLFCVVDFVCGDVDVVFAQYPLVGLHILVNIARRQAEKGKR